MQRYRVNYGLLIGLLVGGVVAAGTVYGVWTVQMSRNAESFRQRADKAEANGQLAEAAQLLEKYLQFRPDDSATRVKLAHQYIKVAQQALEDREFLLFRRAKDKVDGTLFKFPNEDELRAELVDLYMQPIFGGALAKETLGHINTLLSRQPNDVELLLYQAQCLNYLKRPQEAVDTLSKVVGYDSETDTFDSDKALATDEPEAYRLLAGLLAQYLDQRDLALRVLDQMVAANEQESQAYLIRGSFRSALDQGPGSRYDLAAVAKGDLEKALQLNPESSDTLLALAQQSLQDENEEQARQYLQQGIELGTEVQAFYVFLANLEKRQGHYPEALSHIEAGLNAVDDEAELPLLLAKAELQIDQQDLTAAEQTITQLQRRLPQAIPQLVFLQGRMLATRGEWLEASKLFEEVRDQFLLESRYISQVKQTDQLLSLCYEKLGQYDRAYETAQRILQSDRKNTLAKAMVSRLHRRGIGGKRPGTTSQGRPEDVDGLLNWTLRQPEEKQDWQAFEQALQQFFEENQTDLPKQWLIRSKILLQRRRFEEAEKLLLQAYEAAPDDQAIQRAAVALVALNPQRGPQTALRLLDRSQKRFGDSPLIRTDRISVLLLLDEQDAAEQAWRQTEGMADWSPSDQVQVWSMLATKLYQIGNHDKAEEAWLKVAEITPRDLATLVTLFKLALARHDDKQMQAMQKALLAVVGSEEDDTWAYTEAARLLSLYQRGQTDEASLGQAKKLLRKVIDHRPEWHEPHVKQGEILLAEGQPAAALEAFEKGSSLGRLGHGALREYLQLLRARGRFQDAYDALKDRGDKERLALLGTAYPEILVRIGKYNEAVQMAEQLVQARPDSWQQQLWYGGLLQAIGSTAEVPQALQQACLEKARTALQRVVELAPAEPRGWLAWVTFLAISKDLDAAAEAIHHMQLALAEDELPLMLARSYEMLGRWFDAENHYLTAYEQSRESPLVAQKIATFYLGSGYQREDATVKATRLVNHILHTAAEDPNRVPTSTLRWARRTAATMLAATGDYQNLLKAEKLLASNSSQGKLGLQDQLEMARILANRPEPVSRRKAIQLLETIQQQQPLDAELALALGRLYFATDQWSKCRDQMNSVIGRFPDLLAARYAYIQMLLQRGGRSNYQAAGKRIRTLIDKGADTPQVLELFALVADKNGQQQQARAALKSLLPKNLRSADDEQANRMLRVAQLLTQLEDYDTAEKLYAILVQRQPVNPQHVLMMADFIGQHRDPARAFQLLEQLAEQLPLPAVLRTAAAISSTTRATTGDAHDPLIETWLARALREDPESSTLQLLKAEFRTVQQRYDEAAEQYRALLARDDLATPTRAVVLNNLAYLLALGAAEPTSPDEAAQHLTEAAALLGPVSDILDTRAVIAMTQRDYQAAVEDLTLAVTDAPTSTKYFHKAQAHLGLEQHEQASEAWNKALELGLTPEQLGPLERPQYDQVEQKISTMQGSPGA